MYVTHIDSWGLGKNCTKKRVSHLLCRSKERGAIGKVSKLGGDGKVVDVERIQNYLKRTNKDIQIVVAEQTVDTDAEISPEASTSTNLDSKDTGTNPSCSQRSPSIESSEHGNYELNCPYLPWMTRFRLIEDFPKYIFYPRLGVHVTNYSSVVLCTKVTRWDFDHTLPRTRRDHAQCTATVASITYRPISRFLCINLPIK